MKLFSCTFCEKSFTRASSLKGHLATHSKQKLSCLQCNISFENDVDAYTKHMKIKHLKAVDLMREEIKKISDAMAALKDQQNKVAGKVVQEETSVKSKTDNKEKETPRLMEVFEVQQSNGTPSGTIPKLKITIKKEPLNQKENSCNIETLVENNDDGNESDSSTSSSSSSSTSSSSSNSSSSSSNSSDNKNASNGNLSQPA